MSKATIAMLLSGLVFPGTGHFYLKYPRRGTLFALTGFVCVWILAKGVLAQAALVVEQIQLDGGVTNPEQIMELVAQSSSQSGGALSLASVVLLTCWVIGMIDAYRLAKKAKREPE